MIGFDEATVAAVVGHMNDDHLEDSLVIVRALGGVPDATAARVVTVGPDGVVSRRRRLAAPRR